MIQIKKKVQLLSAEGKPYAFDGRSGTSFKARVLMEGDVYALKCTEDQIKELQSSVGKTVEMNINLSSPKESLKIEFVSLETTK